MLENDSLRELLAQKHLSRKEKVLLCAASENTEPKSTQQIRDLAIANGLREAKKWNISQLLTDSKPEIIRTNAGWELTESGRSKVIALSSNALPSVKRLVISSLRKQLPNISNDDCRAFVSEAISAFEANLFRSSVVLSWVGAIAVLYDTVLVNHLTSFNTEAVKRDSKWRPAKTADDLARMKEHDFLQVICAISIIGKSVKDELEVCLKLRNGCGHPNSLSIGEHRTSAHLETLIQNVFSKF